MTYYPPEYNKSPFHCPICQVYAEQSWYDLSFRAAFGYDSTDAMISICNHCREMAYWINGRLSYPPTSSVEPPHPDLPEDCLTDYQEAREVFGASPKAAAALLRLLVQKLMPYLGEKGKDVDKDIASLVKKGLPAEVQKALDICRVVGNHSVHPGKIKLDDSPEIAQSLFQMINFIVETQITQKNKINELYSKLPAGALDHIDERDGNGN